MQLIKDGLIKSPKEVRALYPNISFCSSTYAELGWMPAPSPEPPTYGYIELRTRAYKPVTEQLDMLYWDKINNTNLWMDHITSVKAQYPKE